MDDVFLSDLSSDELTWLHASALLDEPTVCLMVEALSFSILIYFP